MTKNSIFYAGTNSGAARSLYLGGVYGSPGIIWPVSIMARYSQKSLAEVATAACSFVNSTRSYSSGVTSDIHISLAEFMGKVWSLSLRSNTSTVNAGLNVVVGPEASIDKSNYLTSRELRAYIERSRGLNTFTPLKERLLSPVGNWASSARYANV